MQWYLNDKMRLKVEIELMKKGGVNFDLCQDENENLLWRGALTVLGHYHGDVRLVYPENFPYQQMVVYVLKPRLPPVSEHIFGDGTICYMKPSEWSPEWTAYAVYLTTIRFLNAFYSGKLGFQPSLTVNSEPESLFERIKEALFG